MATPDDRKKSASLAAAWNGVGTAPPNSVVSVAIPGGSVLGVQVSGTFVGTLLFEGTIDEANWFPIAGTVIGSTVQQSSAAAPGQWTFGYAGLRQARVRMSAFTSGAAMAAMNVTSGAAPAAGGGGGGAGGALATNVGGLTKSVDVLLTRPATTTAYNTGREMTDVSGAIRTLVGAAQAPGKTGIVTHCLLDVGSNGATKPIFIVYLYDTTSTPSADGGSFLPGVAVQDTLIGYFSLTAWEIADPTLNTGNFAMDSGQIYLPFTTLATANLFMRVKTNNAYTPGVVSDTYRFRFAIQQDA
jgi:hypothetical protein